MADFTEWGPETGPFFHGTKADLRPGDELTHGRAANFGENRTSGHIYFAATLDAAVWGAELALGDGSGRIYRVEPTGPFHDDPNLTDRKFPGNPTRSYRSKHPIRVVEEVTDWEPHSPEVLQHMLDSLAALKARGEDVIDD